jgi:hypothetical protein
VEHSFLFQLSASCRDNASVWHRDGGVCRLFWEEGSWRISTPARCRDSGSGMRLQRDDHELCWLARAGLWAERENPSDYELAAVRGGQGSRSCSLRNISALMS